jgi:hypothetical protein
MTLPPEFPEPPVLQWLVRNPTGIPRRTALLRALAGTTLAGLLSFALARWRRPSVGATTLAAETFGATALGGAVTPFAVTLTTYALDRGLPGRDELLGYSGVMRELLHAGELSFLGALGAGLSRSTRTTGGGLMLGAFGTGLLGALLYAVRGLGPGLGAGAGLLSGVIGGALGRLLGSPRA